MQRSSNVPIVKLGRRGSCGIVDSVTWIVGAPTMFGYGFGISDVRVTLADGEEIDCLQKIYPIGRHFAAGFAGSVAIGFAMVEELRRLSSYADERMACDPRAAFREWPACARTVFSAFDGTEQNGRCHLMQLWYIRKSTSGTPRGRDPWFIFSSRPISKVRAWPFTLWARLGRVMHIRDAETLLSLSRRTEVGSSYIGRERSAAKVAWLQCWA